MKYFTSDWHLGEDRLGVEEGKPNLLYRPFKSIQEQNQTIIENFIASDFKDGDELWHLGDVIYQTFDSKFPFEYQSSNYCLTKLRKRYPNSKFNLIIGNYDEDKLNLLAKFFDDMIESASLKIQDRTVYLNHYPIKCKDVLDNDNLFLLPTWEFSITGHIHSLWKVQNKMINVGVDAWHFKPISEKEIEFCITACEKYYDDNVFPYK